MSASIQYFPRRHYPVIVVGGGQAGLSASYLLQQRGIDHLVLEKHQAFHAWKHQRWDSFCLVTPNWQCRLPDHPYDGDNPHGFMVKDEIIGWMERFRASFEPPLFEGVTVTRVMALDVGGYRLETDHGPLTADQVVIAVSSYHLPKIPEYAANLPPSIHQLDASAYRNPDALPDGAVLVVGTGQSGCQIAEDLHLAGRDVHLAVGPAPRVSRFYRGRDVVDWLDDMGHYRIPVQEHLTEEQVRAKANHYVTGRDGGRDIDLRRFALEGMRLHGRLNDIGAGVAYFGDDLKHNLDAADATNARIKGSIDEYIAQQGIIAPEEQPYQPVWEPPRAPETCLDLESANIGTVIWCIGYAPDFGWIKAPAFDTTGYPKQVRGVTASPGLFFLGLPWQNTWGSGRIYAIAEDAGYIVDRIADAAVQLPQCRLAGS
ncbi:MSMEG_0569 family flavin-dependent oxidoreductase [Alloalcanivorax xenomutans]|jgi:putative flavoprotein involved in K+ transport|uniref:MSMEG_0569 family flavin-dependent oxidoreductase n=1 Tax=Alloalcanivorax xenomutans TaxID=1094342 RepID=UPI000E26EAFA